MAIVTDSPNGFGVTAASTSHSVEHTHAANCKVVVFIAVEYTTSMSITSPAFGGEGLTNVASATIDHSGGPLLLWCGYADTSLGAGAHNVTFGTTESKVTKVYVETMVGAATGAPEAAISDEEGSSAAVVGDGSDITVTAGAAIFAAVANSAASPTLSGVTTVTNHDYDTSNSFIMGTGSAEGLTAGAKSVDWTFSTNSTNKVAAAVSIAAAAASGDVHSQSTLRGVMRGVMRGAA